MNDQELFALRKSQGRDFASPKELRIFLESMLGTDFVCPMVVGPEDFPEIGWKIFNLKPLNIPDRTTVENYLEALKDLQEIQENPRNSKKYCGRLYCHGVHSTHYSNLDTNILNASVRQVKKEGGIEIPSFGLSFYFSSKEEKGIDGKVIGYCASSSLTQTELQKTCERFQGPNRDYRRLLI